MALRLEEVCVDAGDPRRLATWWAELMRWRVVEEDSSGDDYVVIRPADAEYGTVTEVGFVRVPEAKVAKNRLHLDLRPDDQAAEVARAEGLGATRIEVGQSADVSWVVLADPEGNEFCILGALSS